MGCWNETCVLSHTPITAGAPVVALTTVRGPAYKQGSQSQHVSLLFGLPYKGSYDDYGGVERHENEAQVELLAKAFAASGFYRAHATKSPYGSGQERFVAASPDTFWGLEHDLKYLFFSQTGVEPGKVKSFDKADMDKSTAAFKLCQEALVQLGKALESAEFPQGAQEFEAFLFNEVSKAFGEAIAWPAYHALTRNGLFAHQGLLLMHREVYEAVVKNFGQRKLSYYQEKGSFTMRQFLTEQVESWMQEYPVTLQESSGLFSGDERFLGLSLPKKLKSLCLFMQGTDYIKPMTVPWEAPELPLIGHYWGGAELEEITACYTTDEIVDFMIFQWAVNYIRMDLVPPGAGSQNEELKLHQEVMRAAYRANAPLRADFSGTLHRR